MPPSEPEDSAPTTNYGSIDDDLAAKEKRKKTKRIFGVETYDIPWKIYISRALSAWGDRMWSYGSGLFMTS